jgi:hypothetical protein
MPDDPAIASGHRGCSLSGAIGRRTFGRAIGTIAIGGTVQALPGARAPVRRGQSEERPVPSNGTAGDELAYLSAVELVARMRRRQISAREVMAAHLERIARVNPPVNAIVTLVAERAMADAARAD